MNPSENVGSNIFKSRYFSSQILTEIYYKTRAYWRIKAEFRFILIDFLQFFNFCMIEVGRWPGDPNSVGQANMTVI